jgi:uncharacterized protein YdeI (YjbR/CyaY-like superfamily)
MNENQPSDVVEMPDDLAAALRRRPDAAAVWHQLTTTHQRAHVKAIVRLSDGPARTDLVDRTVSHLLDHHAH